MNDSEKLQGALEAIQGIKDICEKYNFWDRVITPYGYGMTVHDFVKGWKGFDLMDDTAQSIVISEALGFLDILDGWVAYENQPEVKVEVIQECEKLHLGEIISVKKELAELMIDADMVKYADNVV